MFRPTGAVFAEPVAEIGLGIGDSEAAARAAGIRVERQRRAIYTLSGAPAGLAGLLFMARINSGDPHRANRIHPDTPGKATRPPPRRRPGHP
ncbi:hypothetical protein [Amaricoccus sp.]|uniref:ABC transporter permease subunit n=1 Tax=Amaricoccus sp. TaxID=1872485 RepID=UPI001B72A53A|nr:hypothetical protein [Amaricoccus sp.]MBP7242419.1 hypothetical protein [Amaricoccus sp.]